MLATMPKWLRDEWHVDNSTGSSSMIGLLITIVVLALVVSVLVWLVKYMGGPEILVKVIVVIAVLIALVMGLHALGIY